MTSNAIDLLRPAIAAEDNGTKKHSRSNENEDNLFGEFLNEESSDKPDPEPRTRELKLPDFAPNFIVQQPLLNISNMPAPTASPLAGPGGTGNTPLPQPPELPQQAEAIERPGPDEPKPGESRPDASKEAGASKPETNKETRQEERAESAKAAEAKTEKTSDSGNASTEGDTDESGSEESNAASNAAAENFLFDRNSEGEIADEELTKKFEQAKANQATQPANPATQTEAPVQAKTATVTAAADAAATAASTGTATNTAQAGQGGAPTGQDAAIAGVTGTSATDATTQTAQTEKSAEAKRMKAPPPVPKQVLKSLKDAIANGDNEIRLRLDPPELGDMKLFLQMDGDKVRVVLETSNDLAKRSLEESLGDLRQMLEDEGIEVSEFVLRDESENPEANADQWAGEDDGFGLPGGGADSEEEEKAATAAELKRASQAYGLFNSKQVNMVA